MKKSLFSHLVALILIFTASIVVTSCNSNNNDYPETEFAYAIVTFESTNDNGSVFTCIEEGDGPLVTFTSIQKVDTEVIPVGTRILIVYTALNGNPSVSGQITVYGYQYVLNAELTEATAESTNSFSSMAQEVASIWRSGEWINVQTQCTYNKEPETYQLVVDESTLDDAYPVAYLIYQNRDLGNATTKPFYATFNISSLWNSETVKGLTVNYVNQSGKKTVTFKKSQNEEIQPTV